MAGGYSKRSRADAATKNKQAKKQLGAERIELEALQRAEQETAQRIEEGERRTDEEAGRATNGRREDREGGTK